MSDLKRDLRRYIDGLEEPVSVQEAMERGARQRRFQVPAAVLAGAAVVLIPALVLVGLRLLPGEDDDVVATSMAPTTVTTVVTDTTTTVVDSTTPPPPASDVVVPDLIGLSEQQARSVLLELGLDLTVAETRTHATLTGVSAQDPAPGAEVASGATVTVDVYIQVGCAARVFEVPEGSTAITLQRLCPPAEYPAHWQALSHVVPAGSDRVAATLQLLLAGPDDWETENGYASMFSGASRNALDAVSLDSGRLIVDFDDTIFVNNVGTSTGSMFFLAELQANLFQFEDIDEIEFRIDGRCSEFWAGLERECRILTRTDWEADLATWDAQSDANPSIEHPIDRVELDVIDKLSAFARGTGPFSELSLATEVTLGLNTVEQITLDAAELEVGSAWTIPREEFGGIVGPFDVLGPLRSGPEIAEVNLGPRSHCAGPPLTFGSEWSQGRHLVIEPTDFDSCLQWFAIHVLLNRNGEIQAVTLDLWEP